MRRLLKNPQNKKSFILFLGDCILLCVIVLLVLVVLDFLKDNYTLKVLRRPIKLYPFLLSSAIYLILLYISGIYERRDSLERFKSFVLLFILSFLSFFITFSFAKIIKINKSTMAGLLIFSISAALLLYIWRLLFIKNFVNKGYFLKKVLFLGRDYLTDDIISSIGLEGKYYQVTGIFEPFLETREEGSAIKALADSISLLGSGIIIIPLGRDLSLGVLKNLYRYKSQGIEVYESSYFYEVLTRKVPIKHYLAKDSIPYFTLDVFNDVVFKNIKRIIDFLGGLFLFILTLPLFMLLFVLVLFISGSPVFYSQERVGFQEAPFKLIKFRTMVKGAEDKQGPQWAQKDDARVTSIGRFLRKLRLDELPQLINIIRGDISFVGPRPIRRHFANIIEEQVPFYSLRFTVKPGLTGWAQVHYDYGGSVEGHIEKFQYDLYYIKHTSLFLDLFILIKTLQTVLRRPAH